MTITIEISKEAERRLRKRADLSGKEVGAFVRDLVEREAERPEPTFEELVAPIHEDFAKSGMTQEELDQLTDELIREVRAETPLRSR
jgi:hypothetical protein